MPLLLFGVVPMSESREIEIGTQVTTAYGAGIVQWIAGFHHITVKIYHEDKPRVMARDEMDFWPVQPRAVTSPTREEAVEAIRRVLARGSYANSSEELPYESTAGAVWDAVLALLPQPAPETERLRALWDQVKHITVSATTMHARLAMRDELRHLIEEAGEWRATPAPETKEQ